MPNPRLSPTVSRPTRALKPPTFCSLRRVTKVRMLTTIPSTNPVEPSASLAQVTYDQAGFRCGNRNIPRREKPWRRPAWRPPASRAAASSVAAATPNVT